MAHGKCRVRIEMTFGVIESHFNGLVVSLSSGLPKKTWAFVVL